MINAVRLLLLTSLTSACHNPRSQPFRPAERAIYVTTGLGQPARLVLRE
jgi:hypothetical protein